jgi:hypothetical protein
MPRNRMLPLDCNREVAPMLQAITTRRHSIDDIHYSTAPTPVIDPRHTLR